MEHINHTEGESLAGVGAERWVVGVGEHLTQTLFVLWVGVSITIELGGWAAANCSKRDGRGILEEYKEKTILLPPGNSNYHLVIIMLKQIIIYLLI